MRNFISAHHSFRFNQVLPYELAQQFDQIYSQSQQLIGEAILICEKRHPDNRHQRAK
jgi:hypothetical protein